MMSWTTRGQLSIDAGIAALTGLQRNSFNRDLNNIAGAVINLFNSDDKTLEYVSSRLRTASDILKREVTLLQCCLIKLDRLFLTTNVKLF
jgi:hypothetical protein